MRTEQEQQFIDFYSDKRVVVTGGAGAIGSYLTSTLVEFGAQVTVVDNLSSGYVENLHPFLDRIDFIEADISLPETAREYLPVRVDLVFHLAAFFANQNSVEFPERDLATNGMGTLHICRWASDIGAGRFVFSSSSCVYGETAGLIGEDAVLDPHTPYAMTKVLGEQYIAFHQDQHGLDSVVLRYFNSYGPGEFPGLYRNVIPNFMDLARDGRALQITGDGTETRDFTYVRDTVCGTLLAGMVPEAVGGTFNIATGRQTRIDELADAINELTANEAGCEYHPPRTWDRIRQRRASIDRARQVLGYDPTTTLRKGIALTYDWAKRRVPMRTEHAVSAG